MQIYIYPTRLTTLSFDCLSLPCDLTFVNQPTGFGTCPKRMSYMFLCLQTITFIMSLGSVKQTITSYVYTTIPSALLLHSTLPTIPYNHWIKHLTYWTDNLQLRWLLFAIGYLSYKTGQISLTLPWCHMGKFIDEWVHLYHLRYTAGQEVCLQSSNLVPRVLRLLGQRFGRRERLWDNGIFIPRIVGFRFYCACLDSWQNASGCFLRMPFVELTFLSASILVPRALVSFGHVVSETKGSGSSHNRMSWNFGHPVTHAQ